jgi:hypothetical protein
VPPTARTTGKACTADVSPANTTSADVKNPGQICLGFLFLLRPMMLCINKKACHKTLREIKDLRVSTNHLTGKKFATNPRFDNNAQLFAIKKYAAI